ncbi:MAG: TetR/AcrR family transcriptional regulator [Bacteroidota bacterium]
MKLKDEVKEARIKEVTLQLVAEEGLSGITMNRVAAAAGFSASMIYTYFKGKTDLIEQTFLECIERLKVIPEKINQKGIPFKVKVSLYFQYMLEVKCSKSSEYNFFKSFKQSSYYKKKHQDILIKNLSKSTFDLLEEGRNYMILKNELDPLLLAALLDGFTEKLAEIHHQQIIDLNQQMVENAFSIFWDGIRQ